MKFKNPIIFALAFSLMPQVIQAQTTLTDTPVNATIAPQTTTPDDDAASIGSETSLNNQLIDNSKQAQEIVNKKNAGQPEMKINHLSGLKSSTQLNSTNLTDQDKQLSENYVHQGLANDIIQKNCSGDMATVCQGQAGNHKFLGINPAMVKALSTAYALFSTVGDFGAVKKGRAADSDNKDNTPGTGGEKKEKANDYCKYIPSATELLATTVQVVATKDLKPEESKNGETAQKDAILKAAKSHDSRAKMAQLQAAGWFGGGACYAVGAATGKFATDKNLVIKIGASVLLGSFYQNEVNANKEYAEKTRKIANMLPGKGDCNPVTDNQCYCSQPSTENDPTYCLTTLHKKKIGLNSYRVSCMTDTLKLDPQCACEANNSCFDKYLENESGSSLQLGLGYAVSPFSPIRSLSRGELVGGTMNSSAYDQTSAIAKRALKELASKLPANNQILTADQKALADAFQSKGIPSNVASFMAQDQPSADALNTAAAKISGNYSGYRVASVNPLVKGSNIVEFSGGNALGYKGSGKKAENEFSGFKSGSRGTGAVNGKIVEFAQKAEAQAQNSGQIRSKSDKPLFEIISLRYQISGRKLLEIDSNN